MIEQIETYHLQIVAIIASFLFLGLILFLIHRKKIKEEYSLIWLLISIIFIVFSFWRDGLEYMAKILGVSYPPAALFMILTIAIFLILIEFSIIISKQSDKSKTLAQEIGLLKQELEELKNSNENNQESNKSE